MTARCLSLLVRVCTSRPWVTVVVAVVLAAAALAYAGRTLTFQSSNLRLLPPTAPYVVRYGQYLEDFGELNDIVVAIQAPSPEEARRYVTRLVSELAHGLIDERRLTYRIDPGSLTGRALLYLPVERLTELRNQVIDYQELIEAYAARPTLAQLLHSVDERIGRAIVSRFMDLGLEDTARGDAQFLQILLEQVTARLDGGAEPYRSPWDRLAGGAGGTGEPRYFSSRDGRYLFVFVEARRQQGVFADNRTTVETIRGAIARLRGEFPAIEAGVTGSPAISSDEMVTAFADSKIAGILALVATLALLLVGLPARRRRRC